MTDRASADAVLDDAIQRWAEAYGIVGPGDVITEFVVVVAAQNPAAARAASTIYGWGSRHDSMPLHHVYGLLEIGRDAVDASCDDD